LSEAIIQGTLPRPSELEVYLSETGIFCRPINAETPVDDGEAVAVGVGGGSEGEPRPKAPGTALYLF